MYLRKIFGKLIFTGFCGIILYKESEVVYEVYF